MKIVTNNAFWREILDHFPEIILVFRIDEEESVHLIFVNEEIKKYLGYKPQEFVLASENDGPIRKELDILINRIAELSHQKINDKDEICALSSNQGQVQSFFFDFKIFQTKSARTNLIVTTLHPVQEVIPASVRGNLQDTGFHDQELFVAESELMKAILSKIKQIQQQDTNVLIQGEKGTGRHTIAKRLAGELRSDRSEVHQIELGQISKTEQKLLLFGGDKNRSDGSVQHYSGILEDQNDIILILSDLTFLSEECQHLLLEYLHARKQNHLLTRIIGITELTLEQLMDAEEFDTKLYYELNFYPLLIPPLRHRKEDLPLIANEWLNQLKQILKLSDLEIPKQELEKLKDFEWKRNFPEFFGVLRESMIGSGESKFRILSKKKINKENRIGTSQKEMANNEVLPFDDMTRKYLEYILDITGGKIYGEDGAAALLQLKPTTLQSKLKKLGLK